MLRIGESVSVLKHTDAIPDPRAVNQDKKNILFSVNRLPDTLHCHTISLYIVHIFILIPRHTACWYPLLFLCLFFMSLMSFVLLFCSCVIGFLSCFFFMTEVSAPFHSTLSSSF